MTTHSSMYGQIDASQITQFNFFTQHKQTLFLECCVYDTFFALWKQSACCHSHNILAEMWVCQQNTIENTTPINERLLAFRLIGFKFNFHSFEQICLVPIHSIYFHVVVLIGILVSDLFDGNMIFFHDHLPFLCVLNETKFYSDNQKKPIFLNFRSNFLHFNSIGWLYWHLKVQRFYGCKSCRFA